MRQYIVRKGLHLHSKLRILLPGLNQIGVQHQTYGESPAFFLSLLTASGRVRQEVVFIELDKEDQKGSLRWLAELEYASRFLRACFLPDESRFWAMRMLDNGGPFNDLCRDNGLELPDWLR